jgi:hypothetical protein
MQREPEEREDKDLDVTIDPGEAAREAREQHRKPPEDESTTERDQIRESGFGA